MSKDLSEKMIYTSMVQGTIIILIKDLSEKMIYTVYGQRNYVLSKDLSEKMIYTSIVQGAMLSKDLSELWSKELCIEQRSE